MDSTKSSSNNPVADIGSFFVGVEDTIRKIEEIGNNVGVLSLEDKVSLGSFLSALQGASDAVMAPIKEALRKEGSYAVEGQVGKASFKSSFNRIAHVTYSRARPKVSAGVSPLEISRLRSLLGEEFSEYFTQRTTYTPVSDFEDRVLRVDDPDKKLALLSLVTVSPSTPRVSFPLTYGVGHQA